MTEVTKLEPQSGDVAKPQEHSFAAQIERICMNPDIPLDRLEKMLDMKERMDAREAEQAFNAALSAASAEMPSIPLNGKGHNKMPYALLKDIIGYTRPVLAKHGLHLSWTIDTGEAVTVTAKLRHIQGHAETTSIVLPRDNSGSKNNVQSVGSSQTYGQRYTGQAILGLSLGDDVDDDGKAAGDGATITAEQFTALRDLVERAGADESKLLAFFKLDHLGELPAARYGEADAMLRKKIKAKEAQK